MVVVCEPSRDFCKAGENREDERLIDAHRLFDLLFCERRRRCAVLFSTGDCRRGGVCRWNDDLGVAAAALGCCRERRRARECGRRLGVGRGELDDEIFVRERRVRQRGGGGDRVGARRNDAVGRRRQQRATKAGGGCGPIGGQLLLLGKRRALGCLIEGV